MVAGRVAAVRRQARTRQPVGDGVAPLRRGDGRCRRAGRGVRPCEVLAEQAVRSRRERADHDHPPASPGEQHGQQVGVREEVPPAGITGGQAERAHDDVALVALESMHCADAEVHRHQLRGRERCEHRGFQRVGLSAERGDHAHAVGATAVQLAHLGEHRSHFRRDHAVPATCAVDRVQMDAVLLLRQRSPRGDRDPATVEALGDEVDEMRCAAEVFVEHDRGGDGGRRVEQAVASHVELAAAGIVDSPRLEHGLDCCIAQEGHVPQLVGITDHERGSAAKKRRRRRRLLDRRGLVDHDKIEQGGARWQQIVDITERPDPQGERGGQAVGTHALQLGAAGCPAAAQRRRQCCHCAQPAPVQALLRAGGEAEPLGQCRPYGGLGGFGSAAAGGRGGVVVERRPDRRHLRGGDHLAEAR